MTMSIREKIMADVKSAMKEKNQVRTDTLRFLQAAIKNKEIELRPNPISEIEIVGVLKKLVNQRKDSITQFQAGGRQDLVDSETAQLKILEEFLPKQMSREELEVIVLQVIAEVKAEGPKDMGKVIKETAARAGSGADNKMISEIAKGKLQGK